MQPESRLVSSDRLGDWLRTVENLPQLMTDPKADPDLWRDLFMIWTRIQGFYSAGATVREITEQGEEELSPPPSHGAKKPDAKASNTV